MSRLRFPPATFRSQIFIAHVLGKMRRHFRRNTFLPCVYLADHIYQFTRRHVLEEVSASPGFKRPLNLNITFKRCEHNDARFRELCPDGNHCVNAAQVWQPEVHERHVWLMLPIVLDGFGAARCLGHEQHVRLVVDDGGNPLSKKGMIVNAEYSDGGLTAHLPVPSFAFCLPNHLRL